ncbi:hypothetical protein [Curtobacterium sp. NPDC089689]|uniref:hypothetical protein n=1 Tax=Curtobacterium sp. NPDC089689 TaxID=3363968 RepID=UPI00381E867C
MNARNIVTLTLVAIAVFALTACAGGPSMSKSPTPNTHVTRADVEKRTGAVQGRIIDAFPEGAVSETSTGGWALLDCSENEIQSSISATLTLARTVPIDATYDAITHELEADGYRGEQSTASRGTKLVITGAANDQYFITIQNDKKRVLISSFSQCFRGSLADQ